MDSGKLAALKKAKWRPQHTCASCIWAVWAKDDWGLCTNPENKYHHQKHQRSHELPAHKSAVCDKWKQDPEKNLQTFLDSKVTS